MSNGKGSKRRPRLISQEAFEANWDAVFGRQHDWIDDGGSIEQEALASWEYSAPRDVRNAFGEGPGDEE